ncbi:MAG: RNA-guided endonuclease TnpB family protein [Lachnospira sp.]|nr:RNA-guided endonuclease TnpB family protein [Lachnospira sp.]
MNKAFRFRLYPNKEQEEQTIKTVGCCRFVYNQMLAVQEENYKSGIKHMSRIDSNNYVNRILKQKYEFLKEVDKFALTNSVYALENGYKKFFRKEGGHPRFKSKHHSSKSYTTNFTNNNIFVGDTYIKLPKLGKVKAVIHREIPDDWLIKSATLKQESDGTYYVSLLYEYDMVIIQNMYSYEDTIGLDYKSDGLYMDSNGQVGGTHKFYRESQRKLAKEQRKLKHKEIGSRNYYKQQKRWRVSIGKQQIKEKIIFTKEVLR